MPPRTRSTHVGALNGHTRTVANENDAPFQASPNMGTSVQDNVGGSNRHTTQPSVQTPGKSKTLRSLSYDLLALVREKRTIGSSGTMSMASEMEASASKRARKISMWFTQSGRCIA